MADPLKIKPVVDALNDIPEPLRMFFAEGEDHKFHLQLDGDPAGFVPAAKLSEFRESNRALNAKVTQHDADLAALTSAKNALEEKLVAFDGIDPVAAKTALARGDVSGKVTQLETQLASEKAAHAASTFKHVIGWEFLKAGGRSEALDFIVAQAARTFTMKDGKVVTDKFSATDPGVSLGVPEWIATQLAEASFAFMPSTGGGAPPNARSGGRLPLPVVDRHDPLAFGKALENIASGRAVVK